MRYGNCTECKQGTSMACPWCSKRVCGDCFDITPHRLGTCPDSTVAGE